MNIGIITSTLVGGILLISILSFTRLVNTNSVESTLGSINQNRLNETVEILSNDFNKIGFRAPVNPIISIASTDFSFIGDIYDNDGLDTTTVRWVWDLTDPVLNTRNPNDYYLKRTGPVGVSTTGETRIPVSYFNIDYYAADGSLTTNKAVTKHVEVEIIIESPDPYRTSISGEEVYYRSVWKRVFIPSNLNLPF